MSNGQVNFLRGVPADEALKPVMRMLAEQYAGAIEKFGTGVVQYATPGLADFNGFVPLKQTLANRFGVKGDPQKRMICSNGGMETFSILLKSLPPGSTIATDTLTYDRVLLDAYRLGLKVVGVPMTDEGCDLDALRGILGQQKIELFYQIGYHHNPTGITISNENIMAVAAICAAKDVLHVVDIAYVELRYNGARNDMFDIEEFPETSAAVGSFTKTISPGAKCGFGAFPEAVVEKMTPVVANTRLNPNYPTQAAIHLLIESGEYDVHLDSLVEMYRPRMEAMNDSLKRNLPEIESPVLTGGFFQGLWLKGVNDEEAFVATAKEKGVIISSAQVFPTGWKERLYKENDGIFLRLTFPALSEEANDLGVARLAEAYRSTI